jgi:hypothetical protein
VGEPRLPRYPTNQQLMIEARSEAHPRRPRHLGNLDTTSPTAYLGYKSFILFITSDTSPAAAYKPLAILFSKYDEMNPLYFFCNSGFRQSCPVITFRQLAAPQLHSIS